MFYAKMTYGRKYTCQLWKIMDQLYTLKVDI